MTRKKRTRRDFLKTTALAAAGLATPYFFTSAQARAAEPKNDKIALAAIGVGGRGSEIGEHAAKLGNLVACADVDLRRANDFVAKRIEPLGGKCEVYQDYRKVLDRKDVEAVAIGTPDHWHVKIAIDAMKSGKDVYCEKPLTLTIEEGELVRKTVQQTGRVVQVGTQQRSEYNQTFLEAVAIARGGRLGKKLKARASIWPAHSGGPYPTQEPPKDLDWDMWLGQAPKVPYCEHRFGGEFRWWFDYSGGQVTDWGVHHGDIAIWALGGEETGPATIEPVNCEFPLGRQLTCDYLLGRKRPEELPNSFNVAHSFECLITLPNGNAIQMDSGDNRLYIAGENGHLAVSRGGLKGQFAERLKAKAADKQWLAEQVAALYKGRTIRPELTHMANFLDCVKDRSLPVSDVFTHLNAVNTCHMVNLAMLLGRKLRWDVAKHRFIGDDEANQLMRRPQREPYGAGRIS